MTKCKVCDALVSDYQRSRLGECPRCREKRVDAAIKAAGGEIGGSRGSQTPNIRGDLAKQLYGC